MIYERISTPSYSWNINSNLGGFIKGRKGIRQGDPLSPYIFVLCMAMQTQLLNNAAIEGTIKYHPGCAKLTLTYLCFADDLVVFSAADSDSL